MLKGSCHCGAVQVQVSGKPRQLTSCNCSICRRYGTLWGYFDHARVKITARKGAIEKYSWGRKVLKFARCTTCGCIIHWEPADRTRGRRRGINFRNFDPADIELVRVRRLDGAKTWKYLD